MREFLRGRMCRVFQSAADVLERTCTENFTPSIRDYTYIANKVVELLFLRVQKRIVLL